MTYSARSVDQPFFFGASPEIKARAKELRKRMTTAEKVLWQSLRKNQLQRFYFRRQHPVSKFIVDFYCHEIRLAIEVDGSVHEPQEQQDRDINRTAELENLGITVIRFTNDEVEGNIRRVAARLQEMAERLEGAVKGPKPPAP